jgi:HK97 family phage major capsid protein
MLDSVKIQRRQSEVRQALAELAKADTLTDETRAKIDTLDAEYSDNERRLRAALVAESEEREAAKGELETRSEREWSTMLGGFEMRQVAMALDHGHQLSGQTAEIVSEMRSNGQFQGIPVPLMALEQRAGETVAAGVTDPISTRPIIDRLFPDSVAAKMGAAMVNIGVGEAEWPVVTSSVSAGWADGELAPVPGPSVFQTTDRPLAPDHNLGIQMKVSRKALKQSGAALEQAVRRDMNSALRTELDKAIFTGTGANGQPLGVVTGAGTYGINSTAMDDEPTYAGFLAEITGFMAANAITSPDQVRALMRPELFGYLESTLNTVTQTTEYYRLAFLLAGRRAEGTTFPSNITMTANALAAPSGTPVETELLFTTSTGGVAPIYVGLWGAVDVVRDPYSDAASGGLRLTALTTADVTVARPAQLRLLTGVHLAAA